jgi:hypothetical protein
MSGIVSASAVAASQFSSATALAMASVKRFIPLFPVAGPIFPVEIGREPCPLRFQKSPEAPTLLFHFCGQRARLSYTDGP